MSRNLQIFTNEDYEPFAVFYFGHEGYGLTKEKAIEEYRQIYEFDYFQSDEFSYIASEPHLFYLFEDSEEHNEDGYNWRKCNADHPKAVACYGVVFK